MPSVGHLALDGSSFSVESDALDLAGPFNSVASARGAFGDLALYAGPLSSCRVHVESAGMCTLTESLSLNGGTLELGTTQRYDPSNWQLLGSLHFALWHDGDVGVWASTGSHSRQWLVDVFGLLKPRLDGGEAVLAGRRSSFSFSVPPALTKTLLCGGFLQMIPFDAPIVRSRPRHSGRKVKAGAAYANSREGSMQLWTQTLVVNVHHEAGLDEAAELTERLASAERVVRR